VPVDLAVTEQAPVKAPEAIPVHLGQLASTAVRTYPSIEAGQASIRASRADISAAKWNRFPSVTAGARLDDVRPGALEPQFSVEQPLWTGGRITGGIERAEAVREVAVAQLDETVEDITVQVVNAYFELVRSGRLETILQESLGEHQRLVESMERRVEQEVSPQSDLELARSRAAQVQQQLSLTQARRYSATQRLAELTGNPEVQAGPMPEYSTTLHHPPTEGAVPQALACDPTRRRLTAEAQVAAAESKIAKAQIMPRVGVRYTHDEDFGSRVGLFVTAQAAGGLSALSAAEGARLRQQASEIQVTVAERELREQVILDVVENTASRGTIESSSAAALAADRVTESFVRQFITGRRTWLDVMNAVRESMSAEMALVEAQTTAMASASRLLLRTCEWRPELMEPRSEQ
jgi:adhesin transport system outer membrane protein